MTEPSVTRNDKSSFYKSVGPNRGTHWAIAGSVAVIMLGSYLIYSNSGVDGNQTISAPNAPAPITSKKGNQHPLHMGQESGHTAAENDPVNNAHPADVIDEGQEPIVLPDSETAYRSESAVRLQCHRVANKK